MISGRQRRLRLGGVDALLCESMRPRGQRAKRIGINRRLITFRTQTQPLLVNVACVDVRPIHAEWVKVAMVQPGPVDKLDAQLVSATRLPNEFCFVNAEQTIEVPDGWYRRLPDANRRNLCAFDEQDFRA